MFTAVSIVRDADELKCVTALALKTIRHRAAVPASFPDKTVDLAS